MIDLSIASLIVVVSSIDDLVRSDFESFRDRWFNWLLFWTAIVAVGLLFEMPEIIHDSVEAIRKLFRIPKPTSEIPPWMKLLVSVGWLLIVVGVMGEFVADSFVSKADGIVTTFNETLLADAQRKTGIASERAASAFERATQTEREASQENERAAQAEQQAEQENERAAKALEAAETARKEAEGFDAQIAASDAKAKSAEATAKQFEAQIAEANKTAAAKLDLAEFKEPRGFHSDKEIQRVIDKCKPFPKTPFIPLVNPDPEAVRLLGVIDDILVSSCDWTPQSDDVFGFAIPLPRGTARIIWAVTGISVLFSPQYPELERPAKALADGLLAVGIKAKAEANNTATKNAVYLVVGQKP